MPETTLDTRTNSAKSGIEHISEEQFRILADNMPTLAWMADAEGSIYWYNSRWYDYTGATADEMSGWGWQTVHDPTELPRVLTQWRTAIRKGEPVEMLFPLRGADKVYRQFLTRVTPVKNKQGVITNWFGTNTDIHEQEIARRTAKESEARFRFMAESLPQKIITADSTGHITYYNPQWTEYTGVSSEVLIRTGLKQYVHPDDLEENMRIWAYAMRTVRPIQHEQRLLRVDGQYRLHLSQIRPMTDAAGKVTNWFGSITDIEDIRLTAVRTEELERSTLQLREQRAQLIELNDAKDEFISLASHQLRTPATGVKQYLGMVLDGFAGELTTEQKKMIEQANLSNEREIIIINDLLKVAQVDAGKVKLKKSPIKIGQLLQSVINDQQSKFAERNQSISLSCPKHDVAAVVDSDRLRMVLENLIDNASKYTPNGNSIFVTVSSSKKYQVQIDICDEGVGIPESERGKLFQKFSRLDNVLSAEVGGSGLGLYWAKKIIDLHDGTISVASKKGEGSVFTIQL